jgi:hypothetical protein
LISVAEFGAGLYSNQLSVSMSVKQHVQQGLFQAYVKQMTAAYVELAVEPLPAAAGAAGRGGRFRIHPRLPSYGLNGDKTTGILWVAGYEIEIVSGQSTADNPAYLITKPRPGMSGTYISHVEAQAAAILRLTDIPSAVLYINNPPCLGCQERLVNYYVPQGKELYIVYPDGTVWHVIGRGPL